MDKMTAEWINMREKKIQDQTNEIKKLRSVLEDYCCDCSGTCDRDGYLCGKPANAALQQNGSE